MLSASLPRFHPRRYTFIPMSRKRSVMESELMRVAADLFCEKGYRATTISDLAAAAGISHATFYSYFRSKEELLRR
jgi:AcrR family transcriptional regulator